MLCEKKPTRPITKLITAKMIVSVFKIFRNIITILPLCYNESMENFPQNPEQNLSNASAASESQMPAARKRKLIIGSIGLICVLIWPILTFTHSSIQEKRISEGVEQSNQEFQKFQEQFGPPKLGDPRLNEFINKQEAQKPKLTVLEIILTYFVYYISPGAGFLFGLLGLVKDKGREKFLGGLSVIGALLIVFQILIERAIFRMV